ncbi:hypothetical protein H0H87_001774 [Tephrocybe sp. NHM501043]|nr:hypothetical protein H0H87_001774 [Tephrocybe sp. NHM501043]
MGSASSHLRGSSRTRFPFIKGFRRRLIDVCSVLAIYYLVKLIYHGLISIGASRSSGGGSVSSDKSTFPACERVGRADDETPISANHVYSPSGLLHTNPDGIHPILALIRSAEDEWDRKLDRASRTLEDAVKEYKRRYRRDPPVGFDDWWDFAQEMESQLPDEYDTIHRELEPFWGMDPNDLVEIQAALETKIDAFTILKNATHDTHLITTAFSDPEKWEQNDLLRGLNEIISLLDPIEPALQPFRAVFSTYPEPTMLSDYHVKNAFLDAASAKKSPLFSYSTTSLYHDIQPPSFFGWTADEPSAEVDPEWENKTDERLLWRGNNVGMVHSDATRWRHAHRSRLVSWAEDINGTANVLIPGHVEDEGWQRVGGGTLVKKALLAPALLDVAFAGKPNGCNVQYCRHIETQYEWRKERQPHEKEIGRHKFILDASLLYIAIRRKLITASNRWMEKGHRQTSSGSWLPTRLYSRPQHTQNAWVHYVPIQVDYSDLYDALLFFRGDLYGEDEHDSLAKRMAYAGKEWSKTFWREEDMTVYFFR